MRKIFTLLIAAAALSAQHIQAQTILEEDFETSSTETYSTPVAKGEGWTTVNGYTGAKSNYNWHNYYHDSSEGYPTITGDHVASCDAPTYEGAGDGLGPREEILLTPELDLNDTYQLQFTWKVSPMNTYDYAKYDLQVRVLEGDDLADAETVFSIQNEQMLRESGVMVFPIDTWDAHISKIDLSDWKGSKVRIAFVFKMFTTVANVCWLDDVSVRQFTPPTGPVASISLDRFNFGEMYIGEKMYTNVITLTNQGKNGLQVTGMDLPDGVACTLDAEKVNLDTYKSVNFQFSYTASMTSPAKADAVIHTTGGDVKVELQASKQFVPDGYLLETFEEAFPPAGWRNNGWSETNLAFEGDRSAYAGGNFSASYLRSPRLDLSEGGEVTFSYYNDFTSEDGDSWPEYDVELQVSYDLGDTWTTKWTSDYTVLNSLETITVDLGEGSDESYIRWYYPAVETDDDGAYEHSSFYLDRILLPNVYGMGGVPLAATIVKPANNAKDVYPRDVVLEWGPAQFADGYKLYVGSNAEANNLIDGLDVGKALTYTIPECDYETTYRWKVVGYNDEGNSQTASTWKFTTQPDMSVVEFPWHESFNECTDAVPTGWLSTTESSWENRRWEPNTWFGYDGTSLYTSWRYAGERSILLSPNFKLPEGNNMYVSFYWGDEHPRSLIKDETGLLTKQNVERGSQDGDLVFEVYADGEWTEEAYLSEAYNEDGETKYWRHEKIDLTKYAGKSVQFRWISNCYATYGGIGALDEIHMDGITESSVAFNKPEWNAGPVNYMKATTSGDLFTIKNDGAKKLQVKEVTFDTDNFECSLKPGDEMKPGEGMPFTIQFNAKDAAAEVKDVMTIAFENGYEATLPVSGEGLAKDVLFYGFEDNDLDYVWKEDFTMIDVDKKTNYDPNYYLTEFENPGQKFAFTWATHNNENLTAHGGTHTIAAFAPADNTAADDWLISKQIVPGNNATFDFYARNLGTSNSVFIGDNDLHSVSVLVSETDNAKTSDFTTTVMKSTEMPYLAENQWNHYTVDLSAFAGKKIYVALRHTTVSANWFALFDDFTFRGLSEPEVATGITQAQIGNDAQVEVYNANGQLVAQGKGNGVVNGLGRGLFILKVKEGNSVRTVRMANIR